MGKGLLKTMSKMGISTLASYRGAQIFEAVGLNPEVVERCFTWTASRIQGIGLDVIAKETELRHARAFTPATPDDSGLDAGGHYQWRRRGEFHLFNPQTVAKLQHSVRSGNYELFKKYAELVNDGIHVAFRRGTIRVASTPGNGASFTITVIGGVSGSGSTPRASSKYRRQLSSTALRSWRYCSSRSRAKM